MVGRLCFILIPVVATAQSLDRYPTIDVHLHTMYLRDLGPNPVTGAAPLQSVEDHARATVDAMKRNNIVLGIVGGPLDQLGAFSRCRRRARLGIPGLWFSKY